MLTRCRSRGTCPRGRGWGAGLRALSSRGWRPEPLPCSGQRSASAAARIRSAGRMRALAPLVGVLLLVSRICRWVAEGAGQGRVSPSWASGWGGEAGGDGTLGTASCPCGIERHPPHPELVAQRPHSKTRRWAGGGRTHGSEAQPVPGGPRCGRGGPPSQPVTAAWLCPRRSPSKGPGFCRRPLSTPGAAASWARPVPAGFPSLPHVAPEGAAVWGWGGH